MLITHIRTLEGAERMWRPPLRAMPGTSLLILVALGPAFPIAARGQVSNELASAQVECNRDQLQALARRVNVAGLGGAPSGIVQSLLLTYANRFGFYEGMVVGAPELREVRETFAPEPPPGPEHQLGFHLDPDVRELLLNPERTPLEQVSMTRETSTSNLVAAGDPFAVRLRLRPTLGGGPGADAGDLVIDNLAAPPADGSPGFRPADTKPGRGLAAAGLTTLCHGLYTDFDRRLFAILERTLRVDLADTASHLRFDTRIALFRGEEPGVFRADVYLVAAGGGELLPGRMELRIEARPGAGGGLGDGLLVLEDVGGQVASIASGTLSIVRPVFGGVDDAYEPVTSVLYSALLSGPNRPEAAFDWRDVLAGTEWGPEAGPAPACGHGTAAEIAATPRSDENTELLALAVGDGVTADQAVYDRLVRDLAAIRSQEPAVASVRFFTSYDGRTLRLQARDAATAEAIRDGEYHEWDCLNEWYGLQSVDPPPATPPGSLGLSLRLKGLYHLETVAADYAELDGIASASPAYDPLPGAPAGTLPSLCVAIDGQTYRYFFDVAGGGPAETYYFTTDASGEVTFVGSVTLMLPTLPPDWYSQVEPCYQALRLGHRG